MTNGETPTNGAGVGHAPTAPTRDPGVLFADGKLYERMMGRWSQIAGTVFLQWLDLPQGLEWLDVGCGNGAFTEVLIQHSAPAALAAIDPSEGQLEFARIRLGAKMARFQMADAQELPFPTNSFDVAVMALVITFVPHPAKAAYEMARVVRPGGWVATYMWDIPGGGLPLHPIYSAMVSMGLPSPTPPGSEFSRQSAMHDLWKHAGLQSIETREIRVQTKYSDFDDFWDSNTVPVGPVGRALEGLSPELRQRLKDRLREQLTPSPDGTISVDAFASAVKGRKPV